MEEVCGFEAIKLTGQFFYICIKTEHPLRWWYLLSQLFEGGYICRGGGMNSLGYFWENLIGIYVKGFMLGSKKMKGNSQCQRMKHGFQFSTSRLSALRIEPLSYWRDSSLF